MSRKKKFVENLSAEEIRSLDQAQKYGSGPDYRQRCHGILLSNQGYEISQISEILDCSYLAVYNWINKWNALGLSGLKRKKGQGRKRKLLLNDPVHLEVVTAAAKAHPQSLKQMLSEIQAELAIDELSPKSLKRFLKKLVSDGNDFAEASRKSLML